MMGRGGCGWLDRVDKLDGNEDETEMSADEKFGVCRSRLNTVDVDRMRWKRYTQNCSPNLYLLSLMCSQTIFDHTYG